MNETKYLIMVAATFHWHDRSGICGVQMLTTMWLELFIVLCWL